jgi:hypothetical protein
MLLPALFISVIVVFFSLRVAVGYSRIVTAIKRLNEEEEAAHLPAQIRAAIDSRWAGSRQSPVFYEIKIGDITWAAKLPLQPAVTAMRRDFRWMIAGIAGGHIVLLLQLVLSR